MPTSALWQTADPDRLACHRTAVAALNYLGQGALVLGNPKTLENPFFSDVPDWALFRCCTCHHGRRDRDQAVITGAYSLPARPFKLGPDAAV